MSNFGCLHSKLDPLQLMVAEMLANTVRYIIETGNLEVNKDWVPYIGMHNWSPTLERRM